MSATSVETSPPRQAPSAPPQRWMISTKVDLALILLTPLLAIPTVMFLTSPSVGVTARTVSIIVTAFFALGHHLPGMIRAYGDSELFQRFKLRFLLAPPLIFLAYFPLYNYHFSIYRLIILTWATWHGFMQLYGFVRIYDAKVGSTSRATANWDWWVCLCGFATARLMHPKDVSNNLRHWYSSGGPLIPPDALSLLRWGALAVCAFVLVGFTVNYVIQSYRGPKPNPLKLVMLISGIGTWWVAMCLVDELILGVALFDICHDVQYLAIVWLYNCRRVNANAQLNSFMRYVFRRGMVLLYLGLITAYGALGLIAPLVDSGAVSQFFYAVIFTSTILHYYYDGFIWKVREPANQAGLGLRQTAVAPARRLFFTGSVPHALKWIPVVVVLGLLFMSDFQHPPLTTDEIDRLEKTYVQSLMGRPELPQNEDEINWLSQRFQMAHDIAAAVPDDRVAQLQVAILLANFGRNEEAQTRLEELVKHYPDYRDAQIAMGEIHLYRGNLDQASEYYRTALSLSKTGQERSTVNLRLGEINLRKNDFDAAKQKFQEALRDDPRLATSIEALENGSTAPPATPQTGSADPYSADN